MSAKTTAPVVSPSSALATAAVVQCLLISSLLLFLLPLPSLVSCNSEGDALSKQKNSFYDQTNLSSWDTSLTTPCTWFHVACDKATKTVVERVELINMNLGGTLNEALGELSSLQYLVLPGNGLTGPIPAALGNLKNLKQLDLSNNKLSGSIPQELSNLKNLRILWLNNNLLSGEVPQSLLGIETNHTFCVGNDNLLTGEVPQSLLNIAVNNFLGNPGLTGLQGMAPPGTVIMPPPSDSGSNSIPPKSIGWMLVITTIYAGI